MVLPLSLSHSLYLKMSKNVNFSCILKQLDQMDAHYKANTPLLNPVILTLTINPSPRSRFFQQESRAAARKPRDAASVLFG